jgi:hypothetical protein
LTLLRFRIFLNEAGTKLSLVAERSSVRRFSSVPIHSGSDDNVGFMDK